MINETLQNYVIFVMNIEKDKEMQFCKKILIGIGLMENTNLQLLIARELEDDVKNVEKLID